MPSRCRPSPLPVARRFALVVPFFEDLAGAGFAADFLEFVFAFVAVFVMPHFPAKLKKTKIGGIFFFVTHRVLNVFNRDDRGTGRLKRSQLISNPSFVLDVQFI